MCCQSGKISEATHCSLPQDTKIVDSFDSSHFSHRQPLRCCPRMLLEELPLQRMMMKPPLRSRLVASLCGRCRSRLMRKSLPPLSAMSRATSMCSILSRSFSIAMCESEVRNNFLATNVRNFRYIALLRNAKKL